MFYKFEEGKDAIIQEVIALCEQKMGKKPAHPCGILLRQFYETVAIEDLQDMGAQNLYGLMLHFWMFIQQREPGTPKIAIYNPSLSEHEWETTHTVIEIITDDMPFLVDSVRMVLNRLEIMSHLIIHMGGVRLTRKDNKIVDVLPRFTESDTNESAEAVIVIEIDRQTDASLVNILREEILSALHDTRLVVEDWQPMRAKVLEVIEELDSLNTIAVDTEEINETKAFLRWLADHHFTFLGVQDYELVHQGQETVLKPNIETGLGLLRTGAESSSENNILSMTPETRELTLSRRVLVMSKTNSISTVHRATYTDYIGVKRFSTQGQVLSELRIIGLYTSAAYNTSPRHIPFLRHKVALVMQNSRLNYKSHAGKVLMNILETLPRDDVIQATADELLELSMGIFHMQERRRIRLFTRTDIYRRFVSCLIYVPKDRVNTELRSVMQDILCKYLHGTSINFSTRFSESVLARIHYIIRIDPKEDYVWNPQDIERQLQEAGRSWIDILAEDLITHFGEEEGNALYAKYQSAFPLAYCAHFSPEAGIEDIRHIETLTLDNPLAMDVYRSAKDEKNYFRFKIYQHDATIPLSDVLPIIEKLGMRAISERPYALHFKDNAVTWINDFTLCYTGEGAFDLESLSDLFKEAFASVWFKNAENDGFNQLVLTAQLSWRSVSVLRAYAKYFKQIGFIFSQDYIESALNHNAHITKKLFRLFEIRFAYHEIWPSEERQEKADALLEEIYTDLDNVIHLDEDKIIRQYIAAIMATLRTNYYQKSDKDRFKTYISLKLNSKEVPGIPKPYPMCEIFVYAPRFEGVHLRCGKVARGGLRWSGRPEDFRTEILGLMKAQQVKNAVIVPSGAKGGFVPKYLAQCETREEIQAEGIHCYQEFIRGLLDITDNYKEGSITKPASVLCYDEDDPYLVVAADKGTATFSDIANDIAISYGFWLGDAFASGGSLGYDHKKIGITARGAWESVTRHFYEMHVDIAKTDFTVVGIGDMAGDVFGNGMLLSKHIKLVAAFNHMHIFIDPTPDPLRSFEERRRLFENPKLTYADYNKECLSPGGGVFSRSVKSIQLTQEMKRCLDIDQDTIEPNECIQAILRAPVDLLWSAGIGTFVKADSENHLDVGDRTNDNIRVNASELRCKVVGEGGNLGFTQLARIEYAMNGGRIYTDFIDNSAGVSCSDKEVNIKILLNQAIALHELTMKERNALLSEMTEEVARLVLSENFVQTRAISLSLSQVKSMELQSRYVTELEKKGQLDRQLEYIPDDKTLRERRLAGKGLDAPSIAVLLCYSKMLLKEAILNTDVCEDPFVKDILIAAFPKPLQRKFQALMMTHPLRREIIATKLSNIIVNEMGFAFVYRIQDETGATVDAVVRAYMIARDVLELESIFRSIQALETSITAEAQIGYMMLYLRLVRRITRWLLKNQRVGLNVTDAIHMYGEGVRAFKKALPDAYPEGAQKQYTHNCNEYIKAGVPSDLAHEFAVTRGLFSVMDIIEIGHQYKLSVDKVAEVYFGIGEFLELSWVRSQIIAHPTDSHWESLSRESLRDDLDWQQRQLAAGIIGVLGAEDNLLEGLGNWSVTYENLITRWRSMVADLRAAGVLNYTMFFAAARELLDLTQMMMQVSSAGNLVEQE